MRKPPQAFVLFMHKGRCSFVAIERASFAFAFPKGSREPRAGVIAAVLFFYSAMAGHLGSAKRERYRTPRIFETDKRTAAMIKLLLWYLLERLVNIPAQCLMCIHSKLMLKVTRALRKSKQADRERSRGNNST